MVVWDKVLRGLKIGFFTFMIFVSVNLFTDSFLFFYIFPFTFLFLYLRERDLKKERTSYLFFLYLLFIVLINIVLYYKESPKDMRLYLTSELGGRLLALLFIYYFIEIFARYIVYRSRKVEVFLFSFILSFMCFYTNKIHDIYLLFLLSLIFFILIIEYSTYLKREYNYYLKDGELVKYWITYFSPYIFIILLLSMIIIVLPFHVNSSLTKAPITKYPYFFAKKTPIFHKVNRVIEKDKIIINKVYKDKNLPFWIKKIARWKVPTSFIVIFLLMEFGLFVFLFLYKIFSNMRFWYIFLFISIGFTFSLVVFFSFLVYKFALYLLENKNKNPSFSGFSGFYGSSSYQGGVGGIVTKTVVVNNDRGIFFSAFLNVLLILIIVISIVIIFIFIIMLIKKVQIRNEISWIPDKNDISASQRKVTLDEEKFAEVLEKDPSYALDYLYSHIRKAYFPFLSHLTPYEFLEKMTKEQDPFIKFWKDITKFFVETKYFSKTVDKETLLNIWKAYKEFSHSFL